MFFYVSVDLIVDIFYEDISWARSTLFVLIPEDYGLYLKVVYVFLFLANNLVKVIIALIQGVP